jgi:hypothetical protein
MVSKIIYSYKIIKGTNNVLGCTLGVTTKVYQQIENFEKDDYISPTKSKSLHRAKRAT